MQGEATMKMCRRVAGICLAALFFLSGCSTSADQPEDSTIPVVQLGGDLVCVEISRFSGGFVEDGSGSAVTDVAAILVANNTREFLELATVTYKVGNSIATFKITGLPAGEQAWVLEQNKMSIGEGDELVFDDCKSAYHPNPICTTEDLEVVRQGNSLTVRNTTGKTLKNICIYYKNRMNDGTFLGGITYLINCGELAAGASVQKSAAHFGENSQIVRYSYQ